MGSKRITKADCEPEWCPVEITLKVIGGRWKVLIIRELSNGTRRYNELRRALKKVTHKMLAQQLRELERDGLIIRTVYPIVPPRVEYSLTPLGTSFGPILEAMQSWGQQVAELRQENGTKRGLSEISDAR